MKKRLFAAFVCLCMIVSLLPTMAFAEAGVQDKMNVSAADREDCLGRSGIVTSESGLCEHHTQHDESCGYTEGAAEIPCSHEHNESCGGLTDPEACNHSHDEACGYVPATAGTPCTFVCEVCNPQDNGKSATPSDAQPEECTCGTLCTEEEVNADCPVCSAEGAELDKVCVGTAPMLPVTALAVEGAPNSLYVGDQQVINGNNTTFWTTDKSTGGLTEYEGNDDNWNVKYDPSTVTLTLKNATIKGVYNNVNTSGSGIYAASSSGPVSLNIVLEEENKVSGMYGINVSSSGGDASLNISGSGSLTVSGLSGNGIGIFMSSQNNANLTIEEASVTALGSRDGGSGVRLITSQTGSPSLTIEVKGGSLQASGETNGIHFLSNVNDATAVANMKVSGNAMVKASNIITTKDGTGSAPELKPAASGSDGTGGIIWDGKNGTVYGDVTLQEDITIGEGESLTIGDGASLDTNGKLTVNGGTLNGTPIGDVTYKVTGVSLNKTELPLFTGESEQLTATVKPDNATNKTVTWESSNTAVATVDESGNVAAVAAGEATITVKTADGGHTATCQIKVTQATYNISIDASLDFAEAYIGYDRPTAKTVTITNTGNRPLTLTQPVSTSSFEVSSLSKTELAAGERATFTVQPKANLGVGSYEETINISGSNGNNQVSTNVTASFAVVDINDTHVKTNLTVSTGITAGISGTAFDTAEKVKSELTRVLVQDAAYTAGNTAFYDVKLQYSLDNGNTWFEATEATFPTEGITVTLPYPSGTGKGTHNFRVVHMFTANSTRLGTTAGGTEIPTVTKTDSGLQVTLKGLSPVVIGWDKIETSSSGGSTTPAATATPAPSDNIIYYTCPSCGYHNWTATEAGYRCDNCGYLESTKQLSGYGNVKGIYTPGSGATSTAASIVPQTGDESPLVLWTVLLLVSGLALSGLAIAKRKQQ